MIFKQRKLIRLRTIFRYGDDIADSATHDLLFEFPEEAKEKKVQIAKAFPTAEFEFEEISTKAVTEADL